MNKFFVFSAIALSVTAFDATAGLARVWPIGTVCADGTVLEKIDVCPSGLKEEQVLGLNGQNTFAPNGDSYSGGFETGSSAWSSTTPPMATCPAGMILDTGRGMCVSGDKK